MLVFERADLDQGVFFAREMARSAVEGSRGVATTFLERTLADVRHGVSVCGGHKLDAKAASNESGVACETPAVSTWGPCMALKRPAGHVYPTVA